MCVTAAPVPASFTSPAFDPFAAPHTSAPAPQPFHNPFASTQELTPAPTPFFTPASASHTHTPVNATDEVKAEPDVADCVCACDGANGSWVLTGNSGTFGGNLGAE